MKKLLPMLALLTLLFTACGTPEPVATPSATLLPSPSLTATPSLPAASPSSTLTATPVFIAGALTIKVNVRSGPGTSYASLGQLEAGMQVQVTVRDSSGTWYRIVYPSAPQGDGWVAAQYVTLAAGAHVPLDATPTPSGPVGSVTQRLNVRSGPATSFNTLGTLEPGTVVSLTGKNTTASWFQIVYASGPGGRGWVTSQYIQADASLSLPVLDDYGNVITPGAGGTPSGPGMTSTPTVGTAYADEDSASSPAVRVPFSALGTHQFVYSSQVSAPQGDLEDWVEFTPYSLSGTTARLDFSLACAGNGTLTVELWQGEAALSGWGALACGDMAKPILLAAGQDYLVHLAPAAGEGLRLVAYTLTVRNDP